MTHPYADLPLQAFWRGGVAGADPARPDGLHRPRFPLGPDAAVATAGSCFAQHVGRALRQAGIRLLDAEPAPQGSPPALSRAHGYGIYSARYGNIYTTRQLVQLLEDAGAGRVDPGDVWTRDGRFYDALRPAIEPGGLVSVEEVMALRRAHLAAVAELFVQTSHFILTLGLTECWRDRETGRVWPVAPGVVAGRFDPARHEFVNLGWQEVTADLTRIRALLQGLRPGMRMILTVSPVPLTATATGGHVLPASTRSKAVLRAAAGEFAETHADVDYFPAYEIVAHPAARQKFYHPNLREVTQAGVEAVMGVFLASYGIAAPRAAAPPPAAGPGDGFAGDVICEEILLEAFRP